MSQGILDVVPRKVSFGGYDYVIGKGLARLGGGYWRFGG